MKLETHLLIYDIPLTTHRAKNPLDTQNNPLANENAPHFKANYVP